MHTGCINTINIPFRMISVGQNQIFQIKVAHLGNVNIKYDSKNMYIIFKWTYTILLMKRPWSLRIIIH